MSVFQLYNGTPMNVYEGKEFANDLLLFGILYQEHEHWLEVGDCGLRNNFTIYISVLSQEAQSLLHQVLPVLRAHHVAYRLLKNERLMDQSNGLSLGVKEAGKNIIIYPDSVKQALVLARELEEVSIGYKGIMPYDCLRIGKVLYTAPDNGVPYPVPVAYRTKRRKGLIGKYYVPIRLLNFNPKGDIQLGVNLKRFSFTHCVIKQARAGSYSDRHGREAVHKLLWQKQVLEAVQDHLPVPKVIDYCFKGEDHFLITEYIEGPGLLEMIATVHDNQPWQDLSAGSKRKLLGYFLQITVSIARLHELGYLHRDIQINNFIIRNECVYLLDFELAYCMPAGTPDPPFGFGTMMFMSPQQMQSQEPVPEDDVYSLGALLAFIILNPVDEQSFSGNIYNALVNAGSEPFLLELVVNCLAHDPTIRPSLSSVITVLKTCEIPDTFELV